jgi:phosphoribosylglycinamide formyltransferase-1
MIRIAVLASGGGSGFESIADAIQAGRLSAQIAAVISDQPKAPVLEKARARGFTSFLVEPETADAGDRPPLPVRRARHEEKILAALDAIPGGRPRFLVLAGYMRILTPLLIRAFRDEARPYSRIVNIHPSLLPAFPGVGGYAQTYAHGAKLAGCTVHLVDEGLDAGPICAQESFSIVRCQSAAQVEKLGKVLEHQLYPQTLAWVLPEKFNIEFNVEDRETEKDQVLHPHGQRRLCVRPI